MESRSRSVRDIYAERFANYCRRSSWRQIEVAGVEYFEHANGLRVVPARKADGSVYRRETIERMAASLQQLRTSTAKTLRAAAAAVLPHGSVVPNSSGRPSDARPQRRRRSKGFPEVLVLGRRFEETHKKTPAVASSGRR